jgi:hypothetical protein
MPKPPTQFKDPADYTVDEIVQAMHAERIGESAQIETTEYRKYRADALRAAGLNAEADASEPDAEPDLASMTPQEHFDRLRRP